MPGEAGEEPGDREAEHDPHRDAHVNEEFGGIGQWLHEADCAAERHRRAQPTSRQGRLAVAKDFVPLLFLTSASLPLRLPSSGCGAIADGRAHHHRRLSGHRGRSGRRAGADDAGQAGVQHRRPARQGGGREPRAGARRTARLRPGAAAEAHHRQPRARRPAEGRQPLRPADRARADGGDGRRRLRCASPSMWCSANWRSTGAITPVAGVLPAAIGANALGARADLPRAPAGRRRPGPARSCRSSRPTA